MIIDGPMIRDKRLPADKRMSLILGGARSGKSSLAEVLAGQRGERVLFVATAEARDEAMQGRIRLHRLARPNHWRTVEAPAGVAGCISRHSGDAQVVLIDCLTMLASNVLMERGGKEPENEEDPGDAQQRLRGELEPLAEWFEDACSHLIIVSNEVGMGLVPPYPLGRAYRDLLGWANQWVAARSDEVYLMVAGIPVDIKGLAARLGGG